MENGGPTEIRLFEILGSTWQYQETLYPRPDIPGREGETLP